MMIDKYILSKRAPLPVKTETDKELLSWGLWFGKADRRVKRTIISRDIDVSTIFLGIDHSFIALPVRILTKKRWMTGKSYYRRIQKKWLKQDRGEYPPIVFETMVFRDNDEHERYRCDTWKNALMLHDEVVSREKKRNVRVLL